MSDKDKASTGASLDMIEWSALRAAFSPYAPECTPIADVYCRLAAIERRIDHLEAHAFAQRAAVEYDRVQGEYVVRGRV